MVDLINQKLYTMSSPLKHGGDMAKPRLHWREGWAYAIWQEGKRTRWKALKTRDKHDATEKLAKFKKELTAGKVKPISDGIRETWGAFVKEFTLYIATRTELSTQKLYAVALQKASDCWGEGMLLPHITVRHLDKFMTDMSKAGLAKPTINKNYRHVKHAVKQAIKWGYLKPLIEFPSQVKEKKIKRAFIVNDIQRLFKILDDHKDQELADIVRLAGYTGMRNGELVRLDVSDIDNPYKESLRITAVQKNATESYIPISKSARVVLDRAMQRAKECGRTKIFRFKDRTYVGQLFKALMRSVGMDTHRFHDLRHTFCSFSTMSGNDVRTTQLLARHASIQTTLGYTDLTTDFLEAASNKLSFEEPQQKIRRVK
jgi:integrase